MMKNNVKKIDETENLSTQERVIKKMDFINSTLDFKITKQEKIDGIIAILMRVKTEKNPDLNKLANDIYDIL